MDLSDAPWEMLEPVFVEPWRPDGKGRPWKDAREVLNGVLWILLLGRRGKIYRIAIRLIKPAIVASGNGSRARARL